jgi:trimethylamine--corrinoid protein Co-methyltransferase
MSERVFKILSELELKRIHEGSLWILENVGMIVEHEKALEKLEAAGAKVDHRAMRAKLPPDLVMKSLARIPPELVYAGRNPENDMHIRVGGPIFARGNSGHTAYIDLQSGEYRKTRIEDVHEWAILSDALPNINGIGPLHAADVPAATSDIHGTRVLLTHGRKHINNQAFTLRNLEIQLEMVSAVVGGREELRKRPLFHNIVAVVSPLYISRDNVDMLIMAAEWGIPTGFADMVNTGATGPATLAGTLALGNAEILGACCLTQVLNPGRPISYFLEPMFTDMNTGAGLLGTPENTLMTAALSQLCSSLYKIPVETAALASDGTLTEEAVAQKILNGTLAVFNGASFIFGCGSVDTFLAQSPLQLTIDDEIVAMVRRLHRGFEVTEESLGLEAVRRAGPKGGFLTDVHTLEQMRKGENFRPTLFNRDVRATWLAKGAKNLEQRAREKAQRILREHKVPPLDGKIVRELEKMQQHADTELGR